LGCNLIYANKMSTEPQNIRISGEAQQATQTTTATEQVAPVTTATEAPVTTEESTTVAEVATTTTETESKDVVVDGEEAATQTNQEEVKVTVTAEEVKQTEPAEVDIWSKLGMTETEFNELKQIKEERSKPDTESKAFADFTQYVVEKKLATKDEILEFENISKTDDKSLVYANFVEKYRKDNPEFTLSDADIQEEFDAEYFIGNGNEKLSKQGQKMLAEEASEIRKPITDKINAFKKDFVIGSNMASFTQQQKTIVEEFNKHKISKTVSIGGQKVTVEVDPAITFDELKNHFTTTDQGKAQNNLLFEAFVQDRTQSEQAIGQLISHMANTKAESKILQAIADNAFEQGQQSAKDKLPGATAPFNSKQETILANSPSSVDETEQYKNYKKKNF